MNGQHTYTEFQKSSLGITQGERDLWVVQWKDSLTIQMWDRNRSFGQVYVPMMIAMIDVSYH